MTTETHEDRKEYAGRGVANTGLGLGIAGTAIGLLNGGLGFLNGSFGANKPKDFVTKEEFDLNTTIMQKDGEIALLKADRYTDSKLLETYNLLDSKISALKDKVDCNRNVQEQFNCTQAVMNATQTATINCMQGQISQLMSLTKIGIPNSNLCPGVPPVTLSFGSSLSA